MNVNKNCMLHFVEKSSQEERQHQDPPHFALANLYLCSDTAAGMPEADTEFMTAGPWWSRE